MHVKLVKNNHGWHKFYTTAGRDSRDKSQPWLAPFTYTVNQMKDLCVLAVFCIREQPNLAHNLVTHSH